MATTNTGRDRRLAGAATALAPRGRPAILTVPEEAATPEEAAIAVGSAMAKLRKRVIFEPQKSLLVCHS